MGEEKIKVSLVVIGHIDSGETKVVLHKCLEYIFINVNIAEILNAVK